MEADPEPPQDVQVIGLVYLGNSIARSTAPHGPVIRPEPRHSAHVCSVVRGLPVCSPQPLPMEKQDSRMTNEVIILFTGIALIIWRIAVGQRDAAKHRRDLEI